jgi:indolepyruvate ferredoxin oxidoreductase alpha subunit
VIVGNLAMLYLARGQLHAAAALCQEVIEAAEFRHEARTPALAAVYGAYSQVRHAWGEWDVARRLSEQALAAARPITVCAGCPHRGTFMAINQAVRRAGFKKDEVMVTGDIGCTILGMNPPFNTIWNEVSMGASIGMAHGMERALRGRTDGRTVAVIGDSTFLHSGITALLNVAYNKGRCTTIILDNRTTAMTGHQEHPGTGRTLNHEPTNKLVLENIARGLGIRRVHVVEPRVGSSDFEQVLDECLASKELCVIIARRPCILIVKRLREYEKCECEQKEVPCQKS